MSDKQEIKVQFSFLPEEVTVEELDLLETAFAEIVLAMIAAEAERETD